MLLNVTWDVEYFVFWDYDILDLICCNSDKWAENLLCHLGWNVAMMNGLIVWAGWNLMGLFDGLKSLWVEIHVGSHHVIITFHVSTTSSSMSVPCHWPCQRHVILFAHVNGHISGHVTRHVDIVWCGNWIYDVHFRHKKWVWLGFGGPGTFYDVFKTSWIKQSVTKF